MRSYRSVDSARCKRSQCARPHERVTPRGRRRAPDAHAQLAAGRELARWLHDTITHRPAGTTYVGEPASVLWTQLETPTQLPVGVPGSSWPIDVAAVAGDALAHRSSAPVAHAQTSVRSKAFPLDSTPRSDRRVAVALD